MVFDVMMTMMMRRSDDKSSVTQLNNVVDEKVIGDDIRYSGSELGARILS